MSFKSTLAAALILAGLGSWYYFYEVKGGEKRSKAKEESRLVFKGLDNADFSEILIRKGKEETRLGKSGGVWSLSAPLSATADSAQADALASTIKNLKREAEGDDLGSNPADYGLQNPEFTLSFKAGSATAGTIFFGMDNPTGQYAYATLSGSPSVFLVQKYAKSSADKGAKDLRDKRFWDFQGSDVTRVESTFGKGLTLEADKDGSWKLSGTVKGKAKADQVSSWLQQLAGMRIDSFVDEQGKNPSQYGLTPPVGKITLTLKGQAKPLSLAEGNHLKGGQGRYYRAEGRPLIFSLPSYAESTLEKKADDLLEKTTTTAKAP